METLEKNGYIIFDKSSHFEIKCPNNEIRIIQKNSYNYTIDDVLDTVIDIDIHKTNQIILNNFKQDNPFSKMIGGY